MNTPTVTVHPNFFFLLISPPQAITEYVSSQKKFLQELIGHRYRSLHSKAHLTLLQYFDFHNESQLYRYEDQISNFSPFDIQLEDFCSFERNGTIYLNIEYSSNILSLAKALGQSIKPHITIARNLSPKDFDLAWKALKGLSYNNSFTCDCVTVLKWVGRKWQSHINLPLAH